MKNVQRRDMERWLLRNGFTLTPGGKTSHRQFEGHGIKITLPGKGPQDLTKKHAGILLRQLRQAGFDPQRIADEL